MEINLSSVIVFLSLFILTCKGSGGPAGEIITYIDVKGENEIGIGEDQMDINEVVSTAEIALEDKIQIPEYEQEVVQEEEVKSDNLEMEGKQKEIEEWDEIEFGKEIGLEEDFGVESEKDKEEIYSKDITWIAEVQEMMDQECMSEEHIQNDLINDVISEEYLTEEKTSQDISVDQNGWIIGGLCEKNKIKPWSRKSRLSGGVVVFSEIMIKPANGPQWIEIFNPFSIDIDLSGWKINGDISYVFPEGTFISPNEYLVISADVVEMSKKYAGKIIGPFTGIIPDVGWVIELRNNSNRVIDSIHNEVNPLWTKTHLGSGASLSKINPTAPSEEAESWLPSLQVGGTPGKPFYDDMKVTIINLVPEDQIWQYSISYPGSGWEKGDFDASSWLMGMGPFWVGSSQIPTSENVTMKVTADNFFAIYHGQKDGENLQYVGRDSIGDWQSVETFTFQVSQDEHIYIIAWEDCIGDQGPQMFIGEIGTENESYILTDANNYEWVLGPKNACPGGFLNSPPPSENVIKEVIQEAEKSKAWADPGVEANKEASPWGWIVAPSFETQPKYIWADTFDSWSVTNAQNTYAVFRTKKPIVKAKGKTNLPLGSITYYFRTTFEVEYEPSDMEVWGDLNIKGGAIIYMNGQEVARINMPDDVIKDNTYANDLMGSSQHSFSVPFGILSKGTNTLAMEVHVSKGSGDMAFGLELFGRVGGDNKQNKPKVMFSEVGSQAMQDFYVEMVANEPINLEGFLIGFSSGVQFTLPQIKLEKSESYVISSKSMGYIPSIGERIFLYTPDAYWVLDGVEVTGQVKARKGDMWLYPDKATPGLLNEFIENDQIVINEIMYHAPPIIPKFGEPEESDEEWIELYNRSDKEVDLGGWMLSDGIEFTFPNGCVIGPDEYLVVTNNAIKMKEKYPGVPIIGNFKGSLDNRTDRIILLDSCGNPVDEVRYHDRGRWPEFADGGGSSLELRDPWADNTSPEAWGPSDESSKSYWEEIVYYDTVSPSPVGPDNQWAEFVVGLLDAGIVLIDDVSVIEDPFGNAKELIQDGSFNSGEAKGWRIIGNHRHSKVVPDPDNPSNMVLKLVATGPTEHMHNHAETTLANGAKVQNGKTYRTSFRARWIAGSNRLNTRLYFNRASHTTILTVPTNNGTPGAKNSIYQGNIGPTYKDFQHFPPVPMPFEPVQVKARVSDPDGVEKVTLYYRVNDGEIQETKMTLQGDDIFSGFVPGQPAKSIVQIWIEAEDMNQMKSTFPSEGINSRALWQVSDGKSLSSGLHSLRIIMTPGDSAWFHNPINVMSNDHIPATMIYDEKDIFYNVGVRAKGSERGRPMVPRLGFDIDLDPEQPFRGIYDDIMIDRSEGVNFGQREMLINQVIAHAGSVHTKYHDLIYVITPKPEHTGSAELQLTRFGNLFLDKQFENGSDGNLYEYELIYYPTTTDNGTPEGNKLPQPDLVIGTQIKDLGSTKEAYRYNFILKNNRWRDDFQKLMEFAKVFGLSGKVFEEQIGMRIDINVWLRSFAFATLSGCIDNYGTGAQHNAFFYIRPNDGRVLYFPHDMDFYPSSPDTPIFTSPDLKKLLFSIENQRLFYAHLYDIISTSYNKQYMQHWCNQFGYLLVGQNFSSHCDFLDKRAKYVMENAGDSILKTFPKTDFQITGGNYQEFYQNDVTIQGTAWIDIIEIREKGKQQILPVSWLSKNQWQVSMKLPCGLHLIVLEGLDVRGEVKTSDSVNIMIICE